MAISQDPQVTVKVSQTLQWKKKSTESIYSVIMLCFGWHGYQIKGCSGYLLVINTVK